MNNENENMVKVDENSKEKEEEIKEKDKDNKTQSHFFGLKFLKKKSMKSIMIHEKFFEHFNHRNSDIIPILNNRMNPLKNCILALSFSKAIRNNNNSLLNSIESYLKTLPGLMNIISNEQNKYSMDEKIKQISINMQYEFFNKNTVMFKYGDKGDKFYIILKGKIGFLTPKKIKCNLNEEEYLTNLIKLYQNGESEIVKNIMRINQQVFDFGEDLEKYITEIINDFYKRNKKYKYSMKIYKKLIELSSNNFKVQSNVNNINIQTYIDMNKVNAGNNTGKNKRAVILYNYQYVNNYEDGQTFGYMALESRSNKRTSTALTITDCELASLTKDEYFEFLGGVHHKTRNNLYELINSLKVLGNISKPTFDYDVIHKIKFINYKTNEIILEENKNFNLFYIFYNGSFKLTVNKNIIGLNELIIKLKKIRGKILGIPNEIIQKDINEQILEINGNNFNKTYSNESIKKEYLKKHNFTISIISESFLLGLPDTIDPETNLSLFNCSCISNFCDGYEISNKVLKMLCKGERYKFNNDVMQTSLTKINYYIKRIYQYKNTLLLKIKNIESSLIKIDRSMNMNKNKNIIKALSSEPRYKSMNNTQNQFYTFNKNSKEKEATNYKYLSYKTSEDIKKSKSPQLINTPNIKFMKTTTNFKSLEKNNFFKTQINKGVNSLPNLYQKRLSKIINMNLLKNKLSKNIGPKTLKLNEHKAIKDIFNKKDDEKDSNKSDSEEDSIDFNDINEILNERKEEKNYFSEEKHKKRMRIFTDNDIKKENKYLKLYEDFMNRQKAYKNISNNNTFIFNPVDEKLKDNKLSLFMDYKKLNNNNNDCDNKYNSLNSLNTMDNIDYFLSKEKMKGNIIINLGI